MGRSRKCMYVLVAVILASALLSYFVRPKAPVLEIVSPRQELPDFTERYPGDTTLAERVSKSYGIALVLMQSPYTERNVMALDALRSWAQENFRARPDFLHPVVLKVKGEPHHTVVDAVCFNLFAQLRYWAEELTGQFLSARISEFHDSTAYNSFRTAYFDLFGFDGDAATLLARYQSDRAKLAIPVILWTVLWTILIALGLIRLSLSKSRYDTLQSLLSAFWLVMAGIYMFLAWNENQLPFLVTSLLSLAAGLFLKYPYVISLEPQSGLVQAKKLNIGSHWIALILWASFSLIAVQIFTWIRMGTPADPDPVTMLLSSLSGNFLYDPVTGKKNVLRIFGAIWIAAGLWTATQLKGDARAARRLEEELASLKGPL